MIAAIDFGSSRIRSTFRTPDHPDRLSLFVERSEYALVQDTAQHRRALLDLQIPFAVCQDALAVVGNQASRARWLSRVPCTPLMYEGVIPSDDPPARQMLHNLVQAMLPQASGTGNVCAVALPAGSDQSEPAIRNREFLCRLVTMAGYTPLVVNHAQAALLACGSDTGFSGISVVMGAETTEICLARHGRPLGSRSLDVGSNWIDTELARHFRIYAWDDAGTCYLDLDQVRTWKEAGEISLRQAMGDRERMLTRLYAVVLDRVARAIGQMLSTETVRRELQSHPVTLFLCGGAVRINGFSGLLTDRLMEHQIAEQIDAVRMAADPELAVVRGALICGELENRSSVPSDSSRAA